MSDTGKIAPQADDEMDMRTVSTAAIINEAIFQFLYDHILCFAKIQMIYSIKV